MARRVQTVGGILLAAIGVAHVVVTFVQYESPSLNALWFLGSGFFVLVTGGINIATASTADAREPLSRALWSVTLLANGAGALLAGGFIWMTGARQPQGLVLLALFLTCGGVHASRPPR